MSRRRTSALAHDTIVGLIGVFVASRLWLIARDFLLHDEPFSCPMLLKTVTVSLMNKDKFLKRLRRKTWSHRHRGSRALIRNAGKVPQKITTQRQPDQRLALTLARQGIHTKDWGQSGVSNLCYGNVFLRRYHMVLLRDVSPERHCQTRTMLLRLITSPLVCSMPVRSCEKTPLS